MRNADSPKVPHAQNPHGPNFPTDEAPAEERTGESAADSEEEYEWIDESAGDIFLTKPTKARNTPGAAVSAQRGSIHQFRHLPNGPPSKGTLETAKGRMICWRRNAPDHFGKVCPQPYNLDQFPGRKEKEKARPDPPLMGGGICPLVLKLSSLSTANLPLSLRTVRHLTPHTLSMSIRHRHVYPPRLRAMTAKTTTNTR